MDIENTFAASIFAAPRTAANACKAGMPQTVPDIIGMALTDIWAFYSAGHFSREHIGAIVDKYVAYDADDEPWPRDDVDWGDVVRLC